MSDNLKVNVEISASTGEAQDAFAKVNGILKGGFDFTKLLNRFQPLTHVLGTVKSQIEATVSASLSWAAEANGPARALGVTATEVGGLSKVSGGLGVSADKYRGAALNLRRSLDAQEGALNANGMATRKANGEMPNVQQVMMNTLGRLREMKPGYDANALDARHQRRAHASRGGSLGGLPGRLPASACTCAGIRGSPAASG
jgi:hypothetical protein